MNIRYQSRSVVGWCEDKRLWHEFPAQIVATIANTTGTSLRSFWIIAALISTSLLPAHIHENVADRYSSIAAVAHLFKNIATTISASTSSFEPSMLALPKRDAPTGFTGVTHRVSSRRNSQDPSRYPHSYCETIRCHSVL